ncbi:MAG: dolichyl-phosphate-mannose--protein O-mannosyl transferase [Verrucomicrobiaceae bacterium]|nr:dolichyl-phosphate-mannose--protein O-mannosyl transferase [Verrucomicrobiaceae bacterium]
MSKKTIAKWMASCAFCLLATLMVSPTQAQQAINAPGNLILNGDFEQGLKGWALNSNAGPEGGEGTMAIDDTQKHANRASLRVDNVKAVDTLVKQKVPVKPNTRYRMTAFIRTKDVTPLKSGSKEGASMAIAGGFIKTPSVTGTKVWTRVTFEFITRGETEIDIGPRLGHYGNRLTGTAWFADLSLVEIGKARGK